jgi:hypothetical protein
MRSRWRLSPSRRNCDASGSLGTWNGDCCARATAASVEIRFTSSVARCDALAIGVIWLRRTGMIDGSSRRIGRPGVRFTLAMTQRSLAGAADWMTCLHDRWIVLRACVSNDTPNGSRVQVDGRRCTFVERDGSVDGCSRCDWMVRRVRRWTAWYDCRNASTGLLNVVDRSMGRRCTSRSKLGGFRGSSGVHRLARAQPRLDATVCCVADTARSSGRAARFDTNSLSRWSIYMSRSGGRNAHMPASGLRHCREQSSAGRRVNAHAALLSARG